MSITQIVIRSIASTVFFLRKKDFEHAHVKFLVFTGTSGKTTMKDAVYYTLHGMGISVVSNGLGYSNELGIILTLLDIENFSFKNFKSWNSLFFKKVTSQFVCIELGADFYKDTEWFLRRFIPYGLFISASDDVTWSRMVENVEKDRRTLLKSVHQDGFIAYNYDDTVVKKLVQESKSRATCISFSLVKNQCAIIYVDVWKNPLMKLPISEAVASPDYLEIHIGDNTYEVVTKALFEPQVYGILAAYSCVWFVAHSRLNDIQSLIKNYDFSKSRLVMYTAKNGAVIIEDSYKATPLCTSWYLNMASKLIAKKKILVLTEMRPLLFKVNEHYTLLAEQSLFAKKVYFLGPYNIFKIIAKNNPQASEISIRAYSNLSKEILENTQVGDIIFLKGSFRYHLDELRKLFI